CGSTSRATNVAAEFSLQYTNINTSTHQHLNTFSYLAPMSIRVEDTIVALATAQGISAIAVIRLSGKNAITITQRVFRGKRLENQPSHTVHFGMIWDGGTPLDEAVVSIFRGPRSFTREDAVEISCHGSPLIAGRIIDRKSTR